MKTCKHCGEKLNIFKYFTKEDVCDKCKKTLKEQLLEIENKVIQNMHIDENQIDLLKKQEKPEVLNMFSNIYDQFVSDKELGEDEIAVLKMIQSSLFLTDEEINFGDRIKPYIYVNKIRASGELPDVDLKITDLEYPLLKKGEIIHFAEKAILKELRSISLGYSGGSRGVSIRIAKGISYRVGAHRGQIIREDRLVFVSQGILIITNQRILLHPLPGCKPVSIILNKISHYHCFENGLEVYKDGREKGYFFEINQKGSTEICGICLGHLLRTSN